MERFRLWRRSGSGEAPPAPRWMPVALVAADIITIGVSIYLFAINVTEALHKPSISGWLLMALMIVFICATVATLMARLRHLRRLRVPPAVPPGM